MGNQIGQSKVHLIGVGGIGMSGIAEVLVGLGAKVSGSDIKTSERTQNLESLGVKVFIGHDAGHVKDVDVVVYSSAVKKENPERQQAEAKQIPVITRAEALAELMRAKRGVAIAGTHGKTTTTSMVAQVFEQADKSPTIVSGGIVRNIGSNAKLGKGEWFIAEADESDGSFERLSPEISVITNIDDDHMEHYGSKEVLLDCFYKFADRIPFYGSVIYCGDDKDCEKIFEAFPKKTISYGFSKACEFYLEKTNEQQVYKVFHKDVCLGEFKSALPGDYNALNSLASMVVGLRAGLSFKEVKAGVEAFSGVRRRFEYKVDKEGFTVLDDYAHHPTEVRAVLKACRDKFKGRKIKCIFQPHRFSRLKSCWDDFKMAFADSSEVIFLPVYAAGEKEIEGYTLKDFLEQVEIKNKVLLEGDFESVKDYVLSRREVGDVVITMGAGDVYKVSDLIQRAYGN